jgi:hypothetical protein
MIAEVIAIAVSPSLPSPLSCSTFGLAFQQIFDDTEKACLWLNF